jgi:hypothetical protein
MSEVHRPKRLVWLFAGIAGRIALVMAAAITTGAYMP